MARRRRGLFLSVMLLLASALGWLGWRLLAQDEQLARQRLAEQRDIAADLLVAAFDQRLSAVEQDLDRVLAGSSAAPVIPTADGAVLARIAPDALRAWPERRLLLRSSSALGPRPGDMAPKPEGLHYTQIVKRTLTRKPSRAAARVPAGAAWSTPDRARSAPGRRSGRFRTASRRYADDARPAAGSRAKDQHQDRDQGRQDGPGPKDHRRRTEDLRSMTLLMTLDWP